MHKNEILAKILVLLKKKNRFKLKDFNDNQINPSQYTNYISGKSKPNLTQLIKLSEMFDVSLDYLVFGEENIVDEKSTTGIKELMRENEELKKIISAQSVQIESYKSICEIDKS